MVCRSVRNQLSPHLDGQLPFKTARRVEAHLERCERCRAELAELRALKALLAGAVPPKAPPGLWDAVHAGLSEHARSQERRPARSWLAWAWGRTPAMAAGLAVLLLASILPVQCLALGPKPSGVSIDELIARHAGYCARQPLLEHGRLHYLVCRLLLEKKKDGHAELPAPRPRRTIQPAGTRQTAAHCRRQRRSGSRRRGRIAEF